MDFKGNIEGSRDLVLLVDDDITTRKILTKYLNVLGFRVLCIEDACFISFSCSFFRNIKLILMDMNMPKMNGYKATKKIRKLHNKNSFLERVPVFAITSGDNEQKCFDAGCDCYLKKPINIEILAESMNDFLFGYEKLSEYVSTLHA